MLVQLSAPKQCIKMFIMFLPNLIADSQVLAKIFLSYIFTPFRETQLTQLEVKKAQLATYLPITYLLYVQLKRQTMYPTSYQLLYQSNGLMVTHGFRQIIYDYTIMVNGRNSKNGKNGSDATTMSFRISWKVT